MRISQLSRYNIGIIAVLLAHESDRRGRDNHNNRAEQRAKHCHIYFLTTVFMFKLLYVYVR